MSACQSYYYLRDNRERERERDFRSNAQLLCCLSRDTERHTLYRLNIGLSRHPSIGIVVAKNVDSSRSAHLVARSVVLRRRDNSQPHRCAIYRSAIALAAIPRLPSSSRSSQRVLLTRVHPLERLSLCAATSCRRRRRRSPGRSRHPRNRNDSTVHTQVESSHVGI